MAMLGVHEEGMPNCALRGRHRLSRPFLSGPLICAFSYVVVAPAGRGASRMMRTFSSAEIFFWRLAGSPWRFPHLFAAPACLAVSSCPSLGLRSAETFLLSNQLNLSDRCWRRQPAPHCVAKVQLWTRPLVGSIWAEWLLVWGIV